MNKEKKTKASIDNIYTLNGKVQIIKWADCYVDSECYADCRNRYVNTVVSNLACWFGTADCNGN